jgi:hypothetical protein
MIAARASLDKPRLVSLLPDGRRVAVRRHGTPSVGGQGYGQCDPAMTPEERLHRFVDELSEQEAAATLLLAERRRNDELLQALADAPPDEEPSSPEEDGSAREAMAAYRRGEAIGPDELKRDLGFD